MNEGRIDSFSLKIIQFFSNKQIYFVTSFVEQKFSHLGSTAPCSTTEKLLVSTADSFAASFAGAPASSSKRTHTTSVVKSSKLRCAIFLPKSAKKGATQFFSESAKNFGQKRPKFEFFLAGIKLKMPHLTIFIAFLLHFYMTISLSSQREIHGF